MKKNWSFRIGLAILAATLVAGVWVTAARWDTAQASHKCAEWSDYHDIPLGASSRNGGDFEQKYVFWGKTCQKWDDQ